MSYIHLQALKTGKKNFNLKIYQTIYSEKERGENNDMERKVKEITKWRGVSGGGGKGKR